MTGLWWPTRVCWLRGPWLTGWGWRSWWIGWSGSKVGWAARNAGRKTLTVVGAMLAGGSRIDHVDRLRAASTGRVLPFRGDGPFHCGKVSAFVYLGACTAGRGKVLTLSPGSGVAGGGRSPQDGG